MVDRPRILVTNDDGFSADGLQALADSLEKTADVWVVAPDSEQSAVSHALTLSRPLRVKKIAEQRFAVDGTPTDCVALAMSGVIEGIAPDIVVSGINYGPNMGVDVHYSGTVSAAFEGAILGVPAIAVSQQVNNGFSWDFAASIATRLVEWVHLNGIPSGTVLNVNVPTKRPIGVRMTTLGVRRYTEGVIETKDPRGRKIYWIGGGEPVWEAIEGSDFYEVDQRYVSVTPLHLDMTDASFLSNLRDNPPDWMIDLD
jgi:5'-nucleotidase